MDNKTPRIRLSKKSLLEFIENEIKGKTNPFEDVPVEKRLEAYQAEWDQVRESLKAAGVKKSSRASKRQTLKIKHGLKRSKKYWHVMNKIRFLEHIKRTFNLDKK